MEIFKTVVTVLEMIASIALIVIVLLQSGKESGLSSTITGNTDTYLGRNKKAGLDRKLATITKWVALVWILLTLSLSLF